MSLSINFLVKSNLRNFYKKLSQSKIIVINLKPILILKVRLSILLKKIYNLNFQKKFFSWIIHLSLFMVTILIRTVILTFKIRCKMNNNLMILNLNLSNYKSKSYLEGKEKIIWLLNQHPDLELSTILWVQAQLQQVYLL